MNATEKRINTLLKQIDKNDARMFEVNEELTNGTKRQKEIERLEKLNEKAFAKLEELDPENEYGWEV